ncbi:hypothetical protein SLS53_008185 [Cytospora paraplurivora]|uniref:Uncharacterized protein n=1 Tax=Cytospora paraplurivora TaxID=2898453 RepID=A0AAN9U187_9PEZI
MDFRYNDFFSTPVDNFFSAPVDNFCSAPVGNTSVEGHNSTSFGGVNNFSPAAIGNTSFEGALPYPSFPPFSLDQSQTDSAAQAIPTPSPSVSPDVGAAPAQPVAPSVGPVRRRGPGRPRKQRPHDIRPAREGEFIGILWTRMDKASKKGLNYASCKQRPIERRHNERIVERNDGEYRDAVAEYEAEKHRILFPLRGRTTESVRAALVAVEQELVEQLSKVENFPEKAPRYKIRVTMAEEKRAYLRGVLVHCEAQGATQAGYQPPVVGPVVTPVEQDIPVPANVAPVEQEMPFPAYMDPVNGQWTGQQLLNDWSGEAQPMDWLQGQTAVEQPYF